MPFTGQDKAAILLLATGGRPGGVAAECLVVVPFRGNRTSLETPDLSKLRIDSEGRQSTLQQRRRRRLFRWISIGFVVLLGIGLIAWLGVLTPPVEVHVAKVSLMYPSRALTLLNASGYVVAQRKAAVASKATGRLQKLFVQEGRTVQRGQILAELENRDLEASLEEARAQLKVTEAALKNAQAELTDATLNYDRSKLLRESGSVSQQAFDSAEARYKKAVAMERSGRHGVDRAKASLKVSEVNLEYSLIRAPFDGVILTKDAEEGEVVAPFGASLNAKAAVVTMADMSSLMVEVDVSESSIAKVKPGEPVEIRLDAFPKERFQGTVHMIVPTADRSKATVMTKVKFDDLDPRVLPQMSAKVAFLSRPLAEGEDRPFLGIPASALVHTDGKTIAYRVNQHHAHSTPLVTGKTWGDTVEVLRGLAEGDLVVISPGQKVRDGYKVKALE